MTFVSHLTCSKTGERLPAGQVHNLSASGAPLLVHYDLAKAREQFSREDIAKRGDNLDVSWLKDESAGNAEDLDEPDVIAAQLMSNLRMALGEMEALTELLESDADGESLEAAE